MTPSSSLTAARPLVIRELRDPGVLHSLCADTDIWAVPRAASGRYLAGFAASERSVELALRLRYQVFNLELQEGLASSVVTGMDRDEFDAQMTHLVVLDRESMEVVGTYRLQTGQQALSTGGFYSAREYDLSALQPYLERIIECGRACIHRDHRSVATLSLLWKGIEAFVRANQSRWLFGCCSLTSIDPDDGWRAMKTLREFGHLHGELRLAPCPEFSCGSSQREFDPAIGPAIRLPKLFSAYMRLGAEVISGPALDREFGTVDFLIFYDTSKANMKTLFTGLVKQRFKDLGLGS